MSFRALTLISYIAVSPEKNFHEVPLDFSHVIDTILDERAEKVERHPFRNMLIGKQQCRITRLLSAVISHLGKVVLHMHICTFE